MKDPTQLTLIGSALACAAVLPQSSLAGGIDLYEIATPDATVTIFILGLLIPASYVLKIKPGSAVPPADATHP